jgi:hypothetical protein
MARFTQGQSCFRATVSSWAVRKKLKKMMQSPACEGLLTQRNVIQHDIHWLLLSTTICSQISANSSVSAHIRMQGMSQGTFRGPLACTAAVRIEMGSRSAGRRHENA